jgi:hypothetical protein
MSLRVAFDLDGTIADMQRTLHAEANRLFPSRPSADTDDNDGDADERRNARSPLTRAQQNALWDHVKGIENFWSELKEMVPGIVQRIAQEAAGRRWEVIFLTTRPVVAGDTVQIQSQRWLQAHGFPMPSVFVVQRSRGKIADALDLDAVVDDRPENCLDVALDSKAAAILVWRDSDKPPLGINRMSVRVVATISDAVDLLIKLDDERRQPSVARKIRKLFGKETTA